MIKSKWSKWKYKKVYKGNESLPQTISLEPNVADLRYFKLWILLDQIIWVWNIKDLQHRVLKILKFKYLILFQRLNFFKNLVTNKIPDKNYMKLESSQELKKKLSVYHKLKRSNLYFFSMLWRKPLIMWL